MDAPLHQNPLDHKEVECTAHCRHMYIFKIYMHMANMHVHCIHVQTMCPCMCIAGLSPYLLTGAAGPLCHILTSTSTSTFIHFWGYWSLCCSDMYRLPAMQSNGVWFQAIAWAHTCDPVLKYSHCLHIPSKTGTICISTKGIITNIYSISLKLR